MAVFQRKSTGRWVAQVYDRETHKKVQIGTFATEAEANAAFEREMALRKLSTITVAQWRETWLQNPSWRESTRNVNTERTSRFAAKYGKTRIQEVSRTHARAWVNERGSEHGSLSAMFGAAMYEDDENGKPLLAYNPFSRLKKYHVKKRDLQPEWLTDDDIANLEAMALSVWGEYGVSFAAMIRFASETGVRPGELFALTHDDLNLQEGTFMVRGAVDSKTRTIQLPKNGKKRMGVLTDAAAAAAGRAARSSTEPYVFTTARGSRFFQSTMHFYWNPVRCAAGRPEMQFYEMRHYCATRLLELGLSDSDVAVQLGHTDGGKLVRDVYGHPADRHARDRIKKAVEDDGDDEAKGKAA